MKKIIKVASVCALITLLSGCIIGPRHGGGWHHGEAITAGIMAVITVDIITANGQRHYTA